MKKIVNILWLLTIILFPLQVAACPHADRNGIAHFQFYNEDYTEMSMLYPRKNYLYNKNIPLNENGIISFANEDTILNEAFGFPLVQDKEAYWDNYWFMDEQLQAENWQDLELKTTIKGIDNLVVVGSNFNLMVGLKNTFASSRKHVDEKVYQMYYNIFTDKLNEDITEAKYSKIIKQKNLKLVIPEILQIQVEFIITDSEKYDYKTEKIEINKFYDNVEVQIKSNDNIENVVAVNLDKLINSSNYIEATYDNPNKFYSFEINEPGVYVLVNKENVAEIEETADTEENINKDVNNKKANFIVKNIVIIVSILILLIIFIIIKTLKRNKDKNNW